MPLRLRICRGYDEPKGATAAMRRAIVIMVLTLKRFMVKVPGGESGPPLFFDILHCGRIKAA